MKIFTKNLLLCIGISFLLISNCYSQAKITGTIRDVNDNKPIKDASVLLFQNIDSIKSNGIGTDEKGFFIFNDLKFGKYRIEISYTGYSNYKINNIELNESNSSVNLDSIKLSSNQYKTDEILIQDEKPFMEFNDDKKVFNIDKIMLSKNGTAIDVLKKLPMIDVDANDNISLRGSANVLILIDNKSMKFSSLRQLPADAILTVEIITNPSAKYEAEGVTGIINIILKKNDNKNWGYNAGVYLNLQNNKSNFEGLGLNLRKNKWSFFLNGGYGNYKYKNENTFNYNYFLPVSFFHSDATNDGDNKYYYGGIGAEYELIKSHSIGFDIYLNSGNYNSFTNSKNYNYDFLYSLNSYYSYIRPENGDWKNNTASLYYNGKFDKIGKEINFDFSYNESKSARNNNQQINYYDAFFNPVENGKSSQINTIDNPSHSINIQLDYTNPFNDKTKYEAGYKGTFRSNNNDFTSDTLNFIVNKYIRNDGLTNYFTISDNINALYGILSHKTEKFRFKIGLRIEHTHTNGELITNGTKIKKDYLDFFPTLSIGHKIGTGHEIQFSYSRRITRPAFYKLNPFVNKSANKFISYGNPELTPEYTNSFELNYLFISNIVNITPNLFYRKSIDIISNYNFLKDTNITVSTYKNSSSGYTYGLDFIISSHAFKWWNLNSTFSFYKAKYETDITNDYSGEEGFYWKGNITSSFTFENLFNIEVNFDYTGKKIMANGYIVPLSSLRLTINKGFFNEKLNIGISGQDLLKTERWGSETGGIGVKRKSEVVSDSRCVYLNISYNFGNTEDNYKKSKNKKNNENEKNDSSDEGKK
jgi:outer membrane receptor protein involved in Fe transport